MGGIYVPGFGPRGAKIAFVGQAPAKVEEQERQPFVGPSGRLVRELCDEAGIDFDGCYRTNVVKYRLPTMT